MRHLKIEKADNGFATLILDNADESMNMVSDAFIADMEEATAILTEDESVKGVILTSGKKTFMAGADLKQLVQGFGKLTARQAYGSEEHTSELMSLMPTSYAVFCLQK